MRRKKSLLIFASFLLVYFSPLSFAQEGQLGQQPASGPEASTPANPVLAEWLYGEVNSVDIAGKALTMTYLDYDTDIEKQATVYTDAKTILENIKSIEEIKPQDMVSVDYMIGADNRNVAVSISVEKPEAMGDFEMEKAVSADPKQQMKPAVENTAVSAAADAIPDSEEKE